MVTRGHPDCRQDASFALTAVSSRWGEPRQGFFRPAFPKMTMRMRAETPASETTRFPIRRSPWWATLLLLFGATPGPSYVELAGDRLVARFGWLFNYSFPLADIEGAEMRSWPLVYRIG